MVKWRSHSSYIDTMERSSIEGSRFITHPTCCFPPSCSAGDFRAFQRDGGDPKIVQSDGLLMTNDAVLRTPADGHLRVVCQRTTRCEHPEFRNGRRRAGEMFARISQPRSTALPDTTMAVIIPNEAVEVGSVRASAAALFTPIDPIGCAMPALLSS